MPEIEKVESNAVAVEKIEPIEKPVEPKPERVGTKRTLNETQRAQVLLNLEKGRETKRRMKEERLAREASEKETLTKVKDELVVKRLKQLEKKKTKLQKEILSDSDESDDEPMFVKFEKKPQKYQRQSNQVEPRYRQPVQPPAQPPASVRKAPAVLFF